MFRVGDKVTKDDKKGVITGVCSNRDWSIVTWEGSDIRHQAVASCYLRHENIKTGTGRKSGYVPGPVLSTRYFYKE